MKKWIGGLFLGLAGTLSAADLTVSTASFVWRQEPNPAFRSGEKTTYVIKYGIMHAGFARLEIASTTTLAGREVFHIFSEAKTNKTVDVFYKVRDKNESWMDVQSLCSHRFSQDIHEGGYERREETVFDQPAGRFVYRKWRKGKETQVEGAIPAFVQDVLSSLFYIRTRPLTPGQNPTLAANSGKENWPLLVNVRRKERVKVPAGAFDCILLEPVLAGEGIFQSKGKLEVWVTDDPRHVPVLLRSKVAVGSFDAEMMEYQSGY